MEDLNRLSDRDHVVDTSGDRFILGDWGGSVFGREGDGDVVTLSVAGFSCAAVGDIFDAFALDLAGDLLKAGEIPPEFIVMPDKEDRDAGENQHHQHQNCF